MDESWRMRIGIPNGGPPSSELEPEDFNDVFGGPPKSLLARKLSADFTGNDWFYREIFRPPEIEIPANVSGRRLPEFMIPGERETCKRKVKRISRSKSTSWSSVMSFEGMSEINPYWSGIVGQADVALSSFTSKLRPINVPSRWSSSSNTSMLPKTKHNKQDLPPFGCPTKTANTIDQCNDYMIKSFNYNYEVSHTIPSPEHAQPAMDDCDMQLNSPTSSVSSLYQRPIIGFNHNESTSYQQREIEAQKNIASSYVIDMNSQATEAYNSEEIDINEAIAWAKDKFQGWSLAGGASPREHKSNQFGETPYGFRLTDGNFEGYH